MIKFGLYIVIMLFSQQLAAQLPGAKEAIEKAIKEKDITAAESLLQKEMDHFYKLRQPDSLNTFIFYVGRLTQLKSNTDDAIKAVDQFLNRIKKLSPSAGTLRQSYVDAAEFYGSAGKNNLGYKAIQEALRYTNAMKQKPPGFFGSLENSMGTYANRMGNVHLAEQHYRSALQYFLSDTNPGFESLYISYNGLGGIMYYASKLDSARYFYEKAVQMLAKTDSTPANRFYRPAIIQNNLSGIYSAQGKATDAIAAMKSCIDNLKKFVDSKEPDPKKASAITFQLEATDNLGGIYKELGNFRQAHELLYYSYQQKLKLLGKDDPAIFISQILLGQLYYSMKEFDKALRFLNEGINGIANSDASYLFWHADACYTMAQVHDRKNDSDRAAFFYEKADSLYEQSLQGNYDNIYLEFLGNAALFYAQIGKEEKALAKANKGYAYVNKTEGMASLLGFNQLLNLSEVHFEAGNYQQSMSYSTQGLSVVNKIAASSTNLVDSVKIELNKPKAILLKVRSQYELLTENNVTSLNRLLAELNEALDILEQRKSIFHDPRDISVLMSEYTELLDFVKQLTLDIYKATGSTADGDQLVSLHESGIYNRIRFRLEKSGTARFAYLPAGTEEKEKRLKQAIAESLKMEGTHNQRMDAYLRATANWDQYLGQLRNNHPHYYNMRYASIFKSPGETLSQIPEQVSVVRYFFVGEELLALVADNKSKHLVQLPVSSLQNAVTALSLPSTGEKKTAEILAMLYQQLWTPIEKFTRYRKVIIIPDGILYNLSFELLTPEKINSYKELATKSILSKYSISYRYSLLLIDNTPRKNALQKSFIAFAPGFTDQMKAEYRDANSGSAQMDNGYLLLLPQPFTISLAERIQGQLGGNTFKFEQSTLNAFRSNAGNHKIIHIGTHAESNNLHPEFSRIIFAKDGAEPGQDNSLYLFDIYDCELSSYLTVLTACETGKPGYQDGEGMISLAHAFSYAGSESIITGLWKIDEQSSTQIMEIFYKNILRGMDKDEALRNAKLDYLSQANGRTLAPQYWAGLVLMGDTSPVIIQNNSSRAYVLIALIVVLLAGGYLIVKKRRR